MSSHTFPLPAVLYVTNDCMDGIVDAGRGLIAVQELLSFMTDQPIVYQQINRAADVCQKYLLDQHPWLGELHPTEHQQSHPAKLRAWVLACEQKHGTRLSVRALPGGAYKPVDPIVDYARTQLAPQAGGDGNG